MEELFSKVTDPRIQGRCLHKLYDVLFIALCTILANGEDFEDMVEFGQQRIEWLKTKIELPNGIPSHDTFNRVFQIIDNEEFKNSLGEDAKSFIDSIEGELVSLDGKKIRGVSPTSKGNDGLFILSAWVNNYQVCIGQQKVEDKSNEIVAIPKLLDELDLAGSIISIDAIGCQTEIAKKILAVDANYLLAIKGNQGDLFEEVKEGFKYTPVKEHSETWEYDHGRYEERRCSIHLASEILSPNTLRKWDGIKTIVMIQASRTKKGATTSETRYYMSSQSDQTLEDYNKMVRSHWGIENHLHWHLDVTMGEDKSRSRKRNAPLNLNVLRKIGLRRLKNMKDNLSLKKRKYRASLNNKYLEKALFS